MIGAPTLGTAGQIRHYLCGGGSGSNRERRPRAKPHRRPVRARARTSSRSGAARCPRRRPPVPRVCAKPPLGRWSGAAVGRGLRVPPAHLNAPGVGGRRRAGSCSLAGPTRRCGRSRPGAAAHGLVRDVQVPSLGSKRTVGSRAGSSSGVTAVTTARYSRTRSCSRYQTSRRPACLLRAGVPEAGLSARSGRPCVCGQVSGWGRGRPTLFSARVPLARRGRTVRPTAGSP